jgi:hypothetical protein
MKKYAISIIGLLALATLCFAQDLVLQTAGVLVSLSETQIVLHYQKKDEKFVINKKTKLLNGDGKKISIRAFKKGEDITVTSDGNSNVAMEVKKGGFEWHL